MHDYFLNRRDSRKACQPEIKGPLSVNTFVNTYVRIEYLLPEIRVNKRHGRMLKTP
jgi:hypothetical protein